MLNKKINVQREEVVIKQVTGYRVKKFAFVMKHFLQLHRTKIYKMIVENQYK